MTKKLYKSNKNIKIDGVCAGVAEYFGFDETLVRLLWVAFCLMGGSGVILYIVCAILMPRQPKNEVYDAYQPKDDRAN